MYELKGVAVHSGASCNSDHYYSFCKVDKMWFSMNDDMVSEITWLLANIMLSKIIYGEGHCCSDLHLKSNSMQISTKVRQGSKNKNRSSFAY